LSAIGRLGRRRGCYFGLDAAARGGACRRVLGGRSRGRAVKMGSVLGFLCTTEGEPPPTDVGPTGIVQVGPWP
jgi:hypothetical protein